jgi:hypothetical protein
MPVILAESNMMLGCDSFSRRPKESLANQFQSEQSEEWRLVYHM